MKSEEFKNQLLSGADKDYGLCPPPTTAHEGIRVLITHFLGDDWYT